MFPGIDTAHREAHWPRRAPACSGLGAGRIIRSLLLAVSLLLSAMTALAEPSGSEAPCEDCHASSMPVTAANAGDLTASQRSLCGGCHRGALEASHPTGFVPDRALPAEFPLGPQGEMTCSTCHVVHGEAPAQLRTAATGTEFCLGCHDATFFSEMADQGRSMHGSGHLDARTQRAWRIDAYSTQCMVCHQKNVSIAGDGSSKENGWLNAAGSVNHPIGSSYRQIASRDGYWGPEMLPDEILLPNGLVSCVSCHDGYSRRHGNLVRPERLCMDCHNK